MSDNDDWENQLDSDYEEQKTQKVNSKFEGEDEVDTKQILPQIKGNIKQQQLRMYGYSFYSPYNNKKEENNNLNQMINKTKTKPKLHLVIRSDLYHFLPTSILMSKISKLTRQDKVYMDKILPQRIKIKEQELLEQLNQLSIQIPDKGSYFSYWERDRHLKYLKDLGGLNFTKLVQDGILFIKTQSNGIPLPIKTKCYTHYIQYGNPVEDYCEFGQVNELGQLHGLGRIITSYHNDIGRRRSITKGIIKEGQFSNGKEHGFIRTIDYCGQTISWYKNGVQHGYVQQIQKNGIKQQPLLKLNGNLEKNYNKQRMENFNKQKALIYGKEEQYQLYSLKFKRDVSFRKMSTNMRSQD